MKNLDVLIQERAGRGELNSLSLVAASRGPGKLQTIFKVSVRNPKNGDLSTGEDVDPVKALIIALRGDNAGINRTSKRSTARIEVEGPDMDFG